MNNATEKMIEVFNNIKEIIQRYDVQEIFDVDLMSSEIKDFIMEDRKRIVSPLLKEYTDAERDTYGSHYLLYNDVQETLKNAGVSHE